MAKRWLAMILVLLIGASVPGAVHPARAEGAIFYESRPDEAALYLSDIAFVRDRVVLPAGQDIRVLLPPGTYPDTLMITENGQRLHQYRLSPQTADMYASSAGYSGISTSGTAYVLSWEADPAQSQAETREITLEYLLPGASWTPTYDMTIRAENSVSMAFFAEIHNAALVLDGATVYLVAGRVDLSQQVDPNNPMTMNQYAVGYADQSVTLPALGVGTVDLQHVYPVGQVTAAPGDTLYVNLADSTLAARRLLVWNAAADQSADVIYKVMNDTEVPFTEGIVRVYQENLFRGSDAIENTPVGSEGSVTAGSLPDLRVHRTESQSYQSDEQGTYYLHEVTLEMSNFGTETLDLIVLDSWNPEASQLSYSTEPQREPDNRLRWEVSLEPGASQTITYEFRTKY